SSNNNGSVKWLRWAPDQNLLLFTGDLLVTGDNELFYVNVTGNAVASTPVKVTSVPAGGYDAAESEAAGLGNTFSPDARRLAIRVVSNFRSQNLAQDDR